MRKHLALLTLFLLLLNCIALPVSAHSVPDTTRTGSLTITMNWDGAPLEGGSLTLRRVGQIAENDGNYDFELIPQLQGSGLSLADLQDPELARKLAVLADEKQLSAITADIEDGSARFSGLETGLYVVTQSQAQAIDGFAPIQPFLISMPQWNGGTYEYDLTADPKVPLETEPEETTEPTEPEPTEPTLPQTGQTNWPIPLLAVCGLLCMMIGWFLRCGKRTERENESR